MHSCIQGFGGEREKWASMSKKLEQQFIQLTGDILLATGTVAYLGYFPHSEREKEIVKWQKRARELDVPFSQDYSLQVKYTILSRCDLSKIGNIFRLNKGTYKFHISIWKYSYNNIIQFWHFYSYKIELC